MGRPSTIAAGLALLACTGCTQPGPPAAKAPAATAPAATATPSRQLVSLGWIVTVYYTAVEHFHTDRSRRVVGCPRLDCVRGHTDLGAYPASFLQAVQDEGTGRTASGRYLNWSSDIGYWLDDAPRDANGGALRPFQSAAADSDVMRPGTRFTITGCGHDDDGSPIPTDVCERVRGGRWAISDEFTPGLGGSHHVDVYIGEEDRPHFTDSRWYTTLIGATLTYA